ncbi:hypothetical protein AB3N59_08435 [Leptospira sp. WS92.C1]
MRILKNIIFIRMQKPVFRFRFVCFVFLFWISILSAETGTWREYSLKELIGRLKYYTYAKVAQSLRGVYPTNQEQAWENQSCGFPATDLPGPFFCGLLKQQNPIPPSVSKDSSLNMENGLSPNIPVIKEYKSVQIYSGSTISGKNVVQIDSEEAPGEILRAFYLSNGQLSHYEFQDSILIFDWSGSKLNGILEVKVDSILRPLSGREILFP